MTRGAFDKFQTPARGLFGDNESRSHQPRVTGASDLVDVAMVLTSG